MKRIPALVCALFIFILLGSCSDGTGGGRSSQNGVSADASFAQSEPETADDPSDQEPAQNRINITIRVRLNETEEEALQFLTDDFNVQNTDGITVLIRNEAEAEEESMGSADLLLADVNTIRATRGLQSLNERIAADYGADADVPLSLRHEAEIAGEQFGVPFDIGGCVFFYNKTLYDDYELEEPATWDALLKAGEELMQKEDVPVAVTDSLTDFSDLILRQNGKALTDGKHAAFTGKEGEEAFSFLMELVNNDYLLLADKGTCKDLFMEERTAGYIGTGSDLNDMYRSTYFEIGAVPVPYNAEKNNPCAPCTMRALALYPHDKETQDAAWAYVRYLTGTAVSARWAVATGNFPVRAAVYLEPEYTAYMETSAAAKASAGAIYGYYLPASYSEDLQYRVREIIGRNAYSNVDGAEICAILTDEINDSLAADYNTDNE